MSQSITNFPVSKWVIVPAPWPVNNPPAPADQKWLVILSGIALVDFKGSGSNWRRDSLDLYIDTLGPINASGLPLPPNRDYYFQVEQLAPFATINAIYDDHTAINAGFAVDFFEPLYTSVLDGDTNTNYSNLFNGLRVYVAVSDVDAWLYRIGYQITMLGKIVSVNQVFQRMD